MIRRGTDDRRGEGSVLGRQVSARLALKQLRALFLIVLRQRIIDRVVPVERPQDRLRAVELVFPAAKML